MGIPTQGEAYSKLMEYLRRAQEEAATLAHLANANDDRKLAQGWLLVSENFKKMQRSVTTLAMRRMQ